VVLRVVQTYLHRPQFLVVVVNQEDGASVCPDNLWSTLCHGKNKGVGAKLGLEGSNDVKEGAKLLTRLLHLQV